VAPAKEAITLPEFLRDFAVASAAVLRVDEEHYQARCELCLRSSPIVGGGMATMLVRIAELGWRLGPEHTWMCPLCNQPSSGRYALP
jgi:hypothetical protein